MITGIVNSQLEPTIKLLVSGPDGRQLIEAVIDTGYNGALALSRELIASLGLAFLTSNRAELADGTEILLDVFDGEVEWNGELRSILVDSGGPVALVGLELLHGFELNMAVVSGGPVSISTLE